MIDRTIVRKNETVVDDALALAMRVVALMTAFFGCLMFAWHILRHVLS